MYGTWTVFLIIVPIALLVGAIIGFLIFRYIAKKQIKELQKKMEEPDKEQVRNMLSALGKKPSEEQVNRFINMAKNSAKKGKNNSKKDPLKKKK
jgi:uncharacterized protein YneF (UPF0154 family)